jgi:acid phosphatase type 7
MLTRQKACSRFVGLGAVVAIVVGGVVFPSHPASATADPTIAAAGDIACDPTDSGFNGGNGTTNRCHEKYTAQLLSAGAFAAVLALGDTQYECGGATAFQRSYDPTWGAVKAITYPVVGNHEYKASGGTDCGTGASGYFGYFGAVAAGPGGYYSFDIGSWHLIALNANCSFVPCKSGSAQERWLQGDLAAHPAACTLAFWHQPRFSAGPTTKANLLPFWNDLSQAHTDLVLNGHKHNYERLTKLNPSGSPDPNGIREIIAGTGGVNHSLSGTLFPGTQASDGTHFGILKVTLHQTSYEWSFVSDAGAVLDSGSDACV